MFSGTGSQTGTNGRWGDYSMTTIDPADNMTFWTVGEYYANTSGFNWHTRIGKFDFVGGGGTPTPTPTTPTPTATPGACSWSAGPDLPSVGSALLAYFSRTTGSFTPWAGEAPTRQATNLLIRSSTILALTAGLPSRRLTLIFR